MDRHSEIFRRVQNKLLSIAACGKNNLQFPAVMSKPKKSPSQSIRYHQKFHVAAIRGVLLNGNMVVLAHSCKETGAS